MQEPGECQARKVIAISIIHDTVRAELVEAPSPFDRLRANGCGMVMCLGKFYNLQPTALHP